jgi:hypothetical protein
MPPPAPPATRAPAPPRGSRDVAEAVAHYTTVRERERGRCGVERRERGRAAHAQPPFFSPLPP